MKPGSYTSVRRYHQRALWTLPLWIAVVGLALGLVLLRTGLSPRRCLSVLGIATALALLSRLGRRRPLRTTASEIDARLGSNNRLEALVELGDRNDPLALAARAESETFLVQHPLPHSYAWFAGVLLFAALVPIDLAFLIPRLAAPKPAPMVAGSPFTSAPIPAVVAVEPLPPLPVPVAPPTWLRWTSPESQIYASAKEEIPLSAEADSTTGLRELELVVAVNGERRAPIPVPGEIAAGVKPLSLSLLIESLEAQPYDVVTYYLQAELIRPKEIPVDPVWPRVFSPLQVVEIRALRDEPIGDLDSADPASALLTRVMEAKREQGGVARDAFALSHNVSSQTDTEKTELVRTTAARQLSTAQQMAAAIDGVAAAGISREAADLLSEAGTEMKNAAGELNRREPGDATVPATRALARLASAEKIVAKIVRENRARQAAEAAATPAAAVASELPSRESTPAGRLEKLATEQKALSERLASLSTPSATFSEQDSVARAIAKLAATPAFPKEINELIKTAGAAANEAARQLNEEDRLAAAEPAARAAQLLSEAMAGLEAVSRERAIASLLAVQRSLNRSATDLQISTAPNEAAAAQAASTRSDAARQQLQSEARRQQENGSAQVAGKLDSLAKVIAASEVKKELAAISKPTETSGSSQSKPQKAAAAQTLQALAESTAHVIEGFQDTEEKKKEQERAMAGLGRAKANLDRLADPGAARGSGPLRWLAPEEAITASSTENLSLVAEASSETGFSKVALWVAVNGQPLPPLHLPTAIAPGVQSITIGLALESLKVRADDVISYLLTAERVVRGAAADATQPEVVYSPLQMIAIRRPDRAVVGPTSGGVAGVNSDDGMDRLKSRLRPLQSAQREILKRTFMLAQTKASPSGKTWEASVKAVETDQRLAKEEMSAIMLKLGGDVDGSVNAALLAIRDEMEKAEDELKKADPAAATPPANRALIQLTRFLTSRKSTGAGAGGEGEGSGGSLDPLGDRNAHEATDLYEQVIESVQKLRLPATTSGLAPPPGPGSTPRQIREYAGLLSERVTGLIQMAAETPRETKRSQVLTTGNPGDAPPAYRPAVADYFEKLARERATPAPSKP